MFCTEVLAQPTRLSEGLQCIRLGKQRCKAFKLVSRLAYLQVRRLVRPKNRRAVMSNARSPSQIPMERQISVKDDTSAFCNNTAAAQPRTPKIQAARLQNPYAETLRNKKNVTTQV